MRVISIILGFISLTACGGNEDYGPDQVPSTDPEPINIVQTVPEATVLNCPKGTNLTYRNFGEAFILNYCLSCHSSHLDPTLRAGATENVNFDSPDDVAIWRASILASVVPEAPKRMPPAANVSPTEYALLLEWLNCGAPSGSR